MVVHTFWVLIGLLLAGPGPAGAKTGRTKPEEESCGHRSESLLTAPRKWKACTDKDCLPGTIALYAGKAEQRPLNSQCAPG